MRDPKRIPELLSLIQTEWEKHPDLRLCQLLSNTAREIGWHSNDLFHLEDDELIEHFVMKKSNSWQI